MTEVSVGTEPPKPTAAHRACIAELVLRFPCPRDVEPDSYGARASLLARDTAALQPGLLRKACDRAAQSARGLPYASEILEAARAIVEERQAAQASAPIPPGQSGQPWGARSFPHAAFQPGSAEHRQWITEVNLYQAHHQRPTRLVLDNNALQSQMVTLGPDWSCNADGTVEAVRR